MKPSLDEIFGTPPRPAASRPSLADIFGPPAASSARPSLGEIFNSPQPAAAPVAPTQGRALARTTRQIRTMERRITAAGATPAPKPQPWYTRLWHEASVPIGRFVSGVENAANQEARMRQLPLNTREGLAQFMQAPQLFRREGEARYNVTGHTPGLGPFNRRLGMPQTLHIPSIHIPAILAGPVQSADPVTPEITISNFPEALSPIEEAYLNPVNHTATWKLLGEAAQASGAVDALKNLGQAALESPAIHQLAEMFNANVGVSPVLQRLGQAFRAAKGESLDAIQPILNRLEAAFPDATAERNAAKVETAFRLANEESPLESSLGGLPRKTMVRVISRALKVDPGEVEKLPYSDLEDMARQTYAEVANTLRSGATPDRYLAAAGRAIVRDTTGATAKEVRALTAQDLADLLDESVNSLARGHAIASLPTDERYRMLEALTRGATTPEDIYRQTTNLLPAAESGKVTEYEPRTGYFHHVYEPGPLLGGGKAVPADLSPEGRALAMSGAGYTKNVGFTKEQMLSDLNAADTWARTHGMRLSYDPVESLAHRLEQSVHASHAQDFLDAVKGLAGTPEGEGVIAEATHAPIGFQTMPEIKGLNGYAVSPDTARYIRRLVAPARATSPLAHVVDSVLGAIRQMIFYTPGPHGLINLPQNAYIAGFNELDPRNWSTLADAADEVKNEGPTYRTLRRAGAYLDTFGGSKSLAAEAAEKADHVPLTQKLNVLRYMHDLTWTIDKFHRTALGMHLMENGATAEDAARIIKQALGYPELSDFEKNYLSRIFLAYPWLKGNLLFQAISHTTSPERVAAIRALADAVNALSTGHPRSQNAPGLEQATVLPFKDAQGRNLMLRHLPGPAKDFEEFASGPAAFIENRLTPPLRWLSQELTGKLSPFNPSDTRPLNAPGQTVPLFGYGTQGVGPQVSRGTQELVGTLGLPRAVGENWNTGLLQRAAALFGLYPTAYDPQKARLTAAMDMLDRLSQQEQAMRKAGLIRRAAR